MNRFFSTVTPSAHASGERGNTKCGSEVYTFSKTPSLFVKLHQYPRSALRQLNFCRLACLDGHGFAKRRISRHFNIVSACNQIAASPANQVDVIPAFWIDHP